jgi:hypothetical protein
MVSLNGTIQSPGSSFTVSGSTITFASNLVTNDVIDFIIVFGNSLSSGVPTDATVTTAKLADDAVTSAKLASLTDKVQLTRARNNTLGNPALEILPSDTVVGYGFRLEQTNNDLVVEKSAPSGSELEIARFKVGGGIALGGTGTANTLDDYEEGTWTGTISDGTNNATMSSNTGGYIKIGSLVVLTGYFVVSSLGSVSGNLRLTGLPFACGSSNAFYTSNGLGWGANLSITDDTTIGFQIDTNASHLNFTHWDNASGTTLLQSSELSADGQFMMNLSYRTDA